MSDLSALDFCPELRRVFENRTATGRSGKQFNSLGALSSLNNVLTIRNLMLDTRPSSTLEVGMAFGGSALTFAATHAEVHGAAKRQHYAMDPYQTRSWDDCALVSLEKAGLRDYVEFRPLHSWLALPQLIQEDVRVDLAYIDGSHLFEDAFVDWFMVARTLAPGGTILFDDAAYPHVAKVLRFIRSNLASHFEEMDLAPYRPDLGRPFRYRVARLLGKSQLRAFRMTGEPEREWNSPLGRF